MEAGKSLGGNFLGRSGMIPYGSGAMLMGGDGGAQGKVGMFVILISDARADNLQLFIIFLVDH